MTETIERAMTAPTTNGEPLLPRRSGARTMLPSTWISRTLRVEYVGAGGEMRAGTGTLLDWCGMGPVFNLAGARTVVGWDRVVLCELVEDR